MKKPLRILAVVVGAGLLAAALWNPAGICRRHEYLFRDYQMATQSGGSVKVRAFACGSRSRGRSIFTHNSVWGAPYQVWVFASQLDPKTHRITEVRLVAKSSGAVITLSLKESRSESASSVLTVFESQEVTFPYADYWVDFAIEERGAAPSAPHRLSLDRDYREFWASDFIDAIMSV